MIVFVVTLLSIFIGLGPIFVTVSKLSSPRSSIPIISPFLIGALSALVGSLGLYFGTAPIVFDKRNGLAHVANLVLGAIPKRTLRNSSETSFRL